MNTSRHLSPVETIPVEISSSLEFYFLDMDTRIRFLSVVTDFLLPVQPYIAKRFFSQPFLKKLQELIHEKEFDILQFEGLYTLQYSKLIQLPCKTRIAYRPHNVEHKIWEDLAKQTSNPLRKVYFLRLSRKLKSFEVKLVNLYDFLVPISDPDKNTFMGMGNSKPSLTLPFGIFPDEFPSVEEPVNQHLFFIGALDWIPNQEGLKWFIREVWPGVKTRHPKMKLFIAGRNMPGNFETYLKADGIHFEGEVENSAGFIRNKTIMIVPLFSGRGMRVKIIEGMAHGRTVIATSKAAEGIAVTHNRNILLADTANEFFLSIEKVITDLKFAEELGREARLFALANFNNFDFAKRLIRFYRSV